MGKRQPKVCPICGKPSRWEGNKWRPFCSKKCRMIDLGQWAMETYRVPGRKVKGGETSREEGEDEKGKTR